MDFEVWCIESPKEFTLDDLFRFYAILADEDDNDTVCIGEYYSCLRIYNTLYRPAHVFSNHVSICFQIPSYIYRV